jgi:hypothetical protein
MDNKVNFKKLNTKRLLAYYRSERKKVKEYQSYCSDNKDFDELDKMETRLKEIKKELDTRENV